MIGGCIISAGYPFLADIYKKHRVKEASGAIQSSWSFDRTVSCSVNSFQSTSFKAQGTNEQFGERYDKQSFLKMLTPENIGNSTRVFNIRSAGTGELIYYEFDLKGKPATWYNSNGSAPVLDPFGRIIQWDTLINRAEAQGDDVV